MTSRELVERESKSLADYLVQTVGPMLGLSILASSTVTILAALALTYNKGMTAGAREELSRTFITTLASMVEQATGSAPETVVWTPEKMDGAREVH
jgi:hypothetical protein